MSPRPDSSSRPPVSAETPRTREARWAIERIAHRAASLILDEVRPVLDELADRRPKPGRKTTAAQVAEHLAVSLDVVYANADQLGAVRIGSGEKPMLRFPPLERIDELLRERTTCPGGRKSETAEPASLRATRQRRPRVSGTEVELLPVRGEEPE
jgi:hypothetical protein